MRPGDRVEIEKLNISSPGKSGKNIVWDFSNASTISNSDYISFSLAGENEICKRINGTRIYYKQFNDTLWWTGFENRIVKMRDSIPAIKYKYPVCFGDSCSGNYLFTGHHSINYNSVTKGEVSTLVDGKGRLILPTGDTINNVLRTKFISSTSGYSIGIKQIDSIPIDSINKVVYAQYEWYAPGYRYPVLTYNETGYYTSGSYNKIDSEAYIISRDNQLYAIKADSDNEVLREN